MREVFNRDALITVALMAIILIALLIGLHFTDNTGALAACQAADHSRDVCELTLNP